MKEGGFQEVNARVADEMSEITVHSSHHRGAVKNGGPLWPSSLWQRRTPSPASYLLHTFPKSAKQA